MTENKRPDRAKKLQDKKGKSETVIKACLRKLLLFDEQKKATVCLLLRTIIHDRANRLSGPIGGSSSSTWLLFLWRPRAAKSTA